MRHLCRILLLLSVFTPAGCHGTSKDTAIQTTPASSGNVREAAVAGLFYPQDPGELATAIDGYLREATTEAIPRLRALICPHAGYRYSGPTAAFAYKLLQGSGFRTAVVLAPSHYARFDGAALPDADAFRTPLGLISVSAKVRQLAASPPFVQNPKAQVQRPQWSRQTSMELPPFGHDTPHTWEHSLEVQLPFLQRTLGTFDLVPAVLGDVDPVALALALERILDDKTIVIASSDLSHYHPYPVAQQKDRACVSAICALDSGAVSTQEACGKLAILTVLQLARQHGWKARLLDLRNSGDTAGEKSNVVGYAAVAFSEPQSTSAATGSYSPAERRFLLDLARRTVNAAARGQPPVEIDLTQVDPHLAEPKGCFVTLNRNGVLRGCIGTLFPQGPLCTTVRDMALSAALRDQRFSPVQPQELDEIVIEISVLTVPQPLPHHSPEDLLNQLRPHTDGVVLQVGGHQATYLPQVWEHFDTPEAFLDHLAEKAGLERSAWRRPEAIVMVYQAEVFSER